MSKHNKVGKDALIMLIILAIITVSCIVVRITRAEECPAMVSLVSTDVLAGSQTTVSVYAEFPEEIHGLVLEVDYDPTALRCIGIERGDYGIPDDAMVVLDYSQAGRCCVGIVCPTTGMSGAGVLVELRFAAAFNQIGVHLLRLAVIDCFAAPVGGDRVDIQPLIANTEINTIDPDVHAALRIMRGIMGILPIPDWGDADSNGVVNAEDVLWIMRRAIS